METTTIIALILSGIFGLCVGSFLNVVIYRCPNNMSLAKPTSHCPKCNNPIKWYDNIPVLSYILLGGKCRHCKEHISFRYTIVEILNALLWMACVYAFWEKSIFYTVVIALVCSLFICIFFVDLEHLVILDRFQLILLVLAIVNIWADFEKDLSWQSKVLGMLTCGAFFLILHYGALIIFKKEALGGGDVKLIAILGLLLGFTNAVIMIIIACVTASIVLLIIKSIKKFNRDKEYPFAPFLVFGAAIALFFGTNIYMVYTELLSL